MGETQRLLMQRVDIGAVSVESGKHQNYLIETETSYLALITPVSPAPK
jgi:hypothetical protein